MPFRERSVMDDREEFCRLAQRAGANKRELCRRWGISPDRGYVWLRRYETEGRAGLADRSRRPLTSPLRSAEPLEKRVLELRDENPTWGGRKLRRVLIDDGMASPPAISTITEILRRHGKLDGPRAGETRDYIRFEHAAPNDLWQMDFKGHFALAKGRCHPLTVLDDHSRFSLAIAACADEQGSTVKQRLTQTFERYGLPLRILCDNGSPWGAVLSDEGHTQLTVWLLDLDVEIRHGRPYHPQTQGKDERFHRTLSEDVIKRTNLADLAAAQKAFDDWRAIYNNRRPHEALGLNVPASRYTASARAMPAVIQPAEYETGAETRTVQQNGWITFKGQYHRFSKAFVGKRVALRPTETDGVFDVCYRRHRLSQVDLRETISQP